MQSHFVPVNTVFSVDSILEIEDIITAKKLMNTQYGNQFSHIPPHLNYMIMPFPQKNMEKGIKKLTEYVKNQKPYKVKVLELVYSDKGKYFYLDLEGEEIRKHHRDILNMMNEFREDSIREKDMDRMKKGHFDAKVMKNLNDYGFAKVMEDYVTHITIGNITVEDYDLAALYKELNRILENIIGKEVIVDNIHGVFHTDAVNQGDMEEIWNKIYLLGANRN